MSWALFCQPVSTELTAILYCYIAEYDAVKIEWDALGARRSCTSELSDYDSGETDVSHWWIAVNREQKHNYPYKYANTLQWSF